jgi:hypothetical protein
LLSIGAGECIFLHRLRTTVRSLISDLLDVTTDSERANLNPSPSTDVIGLHSSYKRYGQL